MFIVLQCWHANSSGARRSQHLADLLELPTEGLSDNPATPKGEQTSYNGVYVLQHLDTAPKKSRFATREQVRLPCVIHSCVTALAICDSITYDYVL